MGIGGISVWQLLILFVLLVLPIFIVRRFRAKRNGEYHMRDRSNSSVLEITNKTIKFNSQVYQIRNITNVGKYRIKKFLMWFRKKEYGLHLETNSGGGELFTSYNEKFIDELVVTISDVMENQAQLSSYTVNIKSASIQNNSIGEAVMGDKFENISNSTIINKSNLNNALNKVASEHGGEITQALKQLAEHLEKFDNREAVELFNGFNDEIIKDDANKTVLKTVWDQLVKVLPDAGKVASAVATVAKIF